MAKISKIRFSVPVIGVIGLATFVLILTVSIWLSVTLSHRLEDQNLPAWIQAVGAILAIVTGFAAIIYQRQAEAIDQADRQSVNARVAYLIAREATATIGERLDAISAESREKHPYRLRGARAAEMISSLREFDTTNIPPHLLEKFLQLRSNFYAINERITEIYESEKESSPVQRSRSERPARLTASFEIWSVSCNLLDEIRGTLTSAGESDLAAVPSFSFSQKKLSQANSN